MSTLSRPPLGLIGVAISVIGYAVGTALAFVWWAHNLDWSLLGPMVALTILGVRWPTTLMYLTPFVMIGARRTPDGQDFAMAMLCAFYAYEAWYRWRTGQWLGGRGRLF